MQWIAVTFSSADQRSSNRAPPWSTTLLLLASLAPLRKIGDSLPRRSRRTAGCMALPACVMSLGLQLPVTAIVISFLISCHSDPKLECKDGAFYLDGKHFTNCNQCGDDSSCQFDTHSEYCSDGELKSETVTARCEGETATMVDGVCSGAAQIAAVPPRGIGHVWLSQDQDVQSARASASFMRYTGPTAPCQTLAADEACEATECPAEVFSTGYCANCRFGGTITVSGAQTVQIDGPTDDCSKAPPNSYLPASTSGVFWNPGQQIAIDVPGSNGDPPPFSATLSGPGRITLTQPSGTTWLLDHTVDTTLTWTGDDTGEVHVENYFDISQISAGPTRYLSCHWPITAGQGSISSSVLSALPKGAANLSVEVRSTTRQTSGVWELNVMATQAIADIAATVQ
jgi:hypothetical protein